MAFAVFCLRIWMVFTTLINVAVVSAFYVWFLPKRGQRDYKYTWEDYSLLSASPVLFLAYLYSMFGRPRLQKIARAVLMSLPAILLLVVGILQIKDAIGGSNLVKQALPQDSGSNPFSCVGAADVTCVIFQGYIFIPVIVGVFVLVEVLVTLLRGPLHEKGYF